MEIDQIDQKSILRQSLRSEDDENLSEPVIHNIYKLEKNRGRQIFSSSVMSEDKLNLYADPQARLI